MYWLINLAIYQISWFILVLGGNEYAWIPLLGLAVHFLLSPCRAADAVLVAVLLLAGLVIDGALVVIGLFAFTAEGFIIPFWLAVLWMVLAILPNHSLVWLRNRWLLSSIFGGVGGPLAYWAGVQLGAAVFIWPLWQALAFLALVWAILWPLVMQLGSRLSVRRNSNLLFLEP